MSPFKAGRMSLAGYAMLCAYSLILFHCRPHLDAKEVYVTGTFDDWGNSEKLDKVGDTFEKEVQLPDASKKILYKVC
jgi:Glycogen recognition site of AMP-activated protein kinase